MSMNVEQLSEELSNLSILEAAGLVKMLEEKWGVKAASGGGMMMAAMPAAGGAPASLPPSVQRHGRERRREVRWRKCRRFRPWLGGRRRGRDGVGPENLGGVGLGRRGAGRRHRRGGSAPSGVATSRVQPD